MKTKLAALLVVTLSCCAANGVRAETMHVSASNNIACTGTLTVASTTGATSFPIGPNSNFDINVTSLSRIVSASIQWNVGTSGTMCLAYCQLWVKGIKHTSGSFVIYDWVKSGPQYSFTTIRGSNTGSQKMECVADKAMQHLPAKYGEYPLP